MKTTTTLLILLLAGGYAFAQQATNETLACDCPDCRAKAASGETGFSLPELAGLEAELDPQNHEATAEDHAEHDEHAEHDLGTEGGIEVHGDMADEVGIQVYEASAGIIGRTSVFPAEIKLNRDRMAGVSPRYDSVVRQVFAEIGDEVKKGDLLASLENRETLAVYSVSAPLDGAIISKDLSVGETVEAGKVLYEVANLETVWADINIFPQYQHLIKKGMPVEFVAHDGHSAQAVVKYISPIVSHETRTFTARCILKDAGEDFTPGVFVRARITTETADVVVRIERAAVQMIDGEPTVFVPDEHGYEPVTVGTGLADDHFIEITHGLEPGERYVAAGAFTLKAELITSGMDPHAGHNH